MINPASLAIESVKTATGHQTVSQTALYLAIAVTIEAFLKKEEYNMDALIYIPEGWTLPVFIMLIAFAFIAPLLAGMFLKNESRHAGEPWTPMYITTLFIDMVITPSLGLIAMSVLVQEFMPTIDPEAYLVLLPIVLIIVAYVALKVMNEGLKAAYEQLKGVAKDAQDIADDIKKL